jgi:hypothetical protein
MRGAKLIDLTGKRYGALTVLERGPDYPNHTGTTGTHPRWRCRCDCGTIWIVSGGTLRAGKTVRCRACSRVPLQGLRFGRLLVIGPASREDRVATKARWLCKCDCGKTINTRTDYLRTGRATSCGCWLNSARKGLYTAAWNQVYTKLKNLAYRRKDRVLEWSLDRAETIALAKSNCHYCGAEPFQRRTTKSAQKDDVMFTSLDRVDSAGGYTRDNVVPCCRNCNYAKNALSVEEFRAWICRVHAHFIVGGQAASSSTNS